MGPPSAESLIGLRVDDNIAIAGDSAYEDHIRHTAKVLQGYAEKDLAAAVDNGLLDNLDPVLDTLPYAHALNARVRQSVSGNQLADDLHPGNSLWARVAVFLATCNAVEARYIGKIWTYLFDTLFSSASYTQLHPDAPASVVGALAAALVHLDPKCNTLTFHHLNLARLALQSGASAQALPVLSNNATHLPSRTAANPDRQLCCSLTCPSHIFLHRESGFSGKATIQNVQEYFILTALIHIAVQDWASAAFRLEYVLVTPCSNNPNGYMVEAYKKLTIVNLLAYGQSRGLPRGIQQQTMKVLRNVSKPYEAVAEAFLRSDYRKLLAEVDEGTSFWTEDGNVGLMQRALAEHQRRSVTSLGKTYAALPITKVAKLINMRDQDTAEYLQRLIQAGALNAQLDQTQSGESVVRFQNDGVTEQSAKSEVQLRTQLLAQTRRIEALAEEIKLADHTISMKRIYVDSARRARNKKTDPGLGAEDGPDVFPRGLETDDEDVMADS